MVRFGTWKVCELSFDFYLATNPLSGLLSTRNLCTRHALFWFGRRLFSKTETHFHPNVLKNREAELFSDLTDYSLENMGNLKLNHDLRNQLLDQLVRYYQLHLPGFGELKSLDVFAGGVKLNLLDIFLIILVRCAYMIYPPASKKFSHFNTKH